MTALESLFRHNAAAVGDKLRALLPSAEGPEARLVEAMAYSVLAGGKRLRPFLVIASSEMFGVARECALRVAAAVEMVHTYSLVHDDLPCMDDDALRRGKPAAHIAFDEATAVLAGDALLTLAFGVLAEVETHSDPEVRCEIIRALAAAGGCHGMVGGQIIDLQAKNQTLDAGAVTRLQQLKTGGLIAFSCESGAILGKAPRQLRHALHAYAHDLGLAFQIADDLLDNQGSAAKLGKAVGKDDRMGKATMVALLGPERARTQAEMLARQAAAHLDAFAEKAQTLRAVADFVVTRDR